MQLIKPLRTFKFTYGLILTVVGTAELYTTLSWFKNYFSELGFVIEWGHVAPVAIFALLGTLLIFHSQRMIRNLPISLFECVESLSVLAVLLGINFFGKPFG